MGTFPRNHQKQDTKLIWALNFVQKSICSSEELSTVAFECWFLFSCAQACHSSEKAPTISVHTQRSCSSLCVCTKSCWSQSVCIHLVSIYWFLCKEPKHCSNNQLSSLAPCLFQQLLEKWERYGECPFGIPLEILLTWMDQTRLHFSIAVTDWEKSIETKIQTVLLLAEITGFKELGKEHLKK